MTVALKELRERALATGLLQEPFGFSINDERTIAVITMAVAGKGTDATSDRALAALRDEVLPATFAKRPGVRTYVTGTTAMSKDTIIRAILLPATMKLLGDCNWYLPRRLHWLPGMAPERPAQVVAATLDEPLPRTNGKHPPVHQAGTSARSRASST